MINKYVNELNRSKFNFDKDKKSLLFKPDNKKTFSKMRKMLF